MAELFVPSPDEVRDQMLEDLELSAIDAGVANPPTEPGTDWYALAEAEGNVHGITIQNVALATESLTPLTATGEKLDEWRASLGLEEISARGATGRIIVETTGTATVQEGDQLTNKAGIRYEVGQTYTGVANNDEVEVDAIDVGDATNMDPGETLTWVAPPVNVRSQATVSTTDPLRGGLDKERDADKRARVLARLQSTPSGGNWGYMRQLAIKASPAVQGCWVYPAIGGPSSAKVSIATGYDPDIRDFSRTASQSLLNLVRAKIHGNVPDGNEIVVESVADEATDVALVVDIPDSTLRGGDGTGWLDPSPWPDLNGDTYVAVTAATATNQITVGALTTSAPVAGQTHVAWWNPVDQVFETRLVIAQSGSAGAWVLTLDRPLVATDGTAVATGDYLSPAAVNLTAYGVTMRDFFEKLGPGENTSASARLPRGARKPEPETQDPAALDGRALRALVKAHPEVADVSWSYRSTTTPTVPANVAIAANVLVLDNFGVYPE